VSLDGVASEEAVSTLRRFVDGWQTRVAGELGGCAAWHEGGPSVCEALPCASAAHLGSLAATDNPAFSKAARVLAHLLCETWRLRDEALARGLPALVAFGEWPGCEEPRPDGALAADLAASLPRLQEALSCVEQAGATALNLAAQLGAVYGERARAHAPLHSVRLRCAFAALGECLALHAAWDAAVEAAPALSAAVGAARRALANSPPPSGADQLDGALRALEARLGGSQPGFLDALLRRCCAEGEAGAGPRAGGRRFLEELAAAAGEQLEASLQRVAGLAERPGDRADAAGALCLAVLHARLSGGADRTLLALAWAAQQRAPQLPLGLHLALRPAEFLRRHLPQGMLAQGGACANDPPALRAAAVHALEGSLEHECAQLQAAAAAWACRAEARGGAVGGGLLGARQLRSTLQGLFLASRARAQLLAALQAHWGAGAPLTSRRLRALAGLAELLQALRGSLASRAGAHALAASAAARTARQRAWRALGPAGDALAAGLPAWSGRGDGARLDGLAALALARSSLLCGAFTRPRRALLAVALDVLCDARCLGEAEAAEARGLAALAAALAEPRAGLAQATDTSFLYFSRELLPAVLGDALAAPQQAARLPLALGAFGQAHALLRAAGAPPAASAALLRELRGCVESCVVAPLVSALEEDLRLRLHAARLLGAVAPSPQAPGPEIAALLALPPLRLPGGAPPLHLRRLAQEALNASFHNHTGLALHDWRSYSEMRRIAADAHGLHLRPVSLPAQTLEQGLDVLEIVRNLHLFTTRFAYALHANAFVERPRAAAERRHLHVVAVRHVANSVRTHGSGIANTTVNCVYQFLAAKLAVASQFLFDDHIRSMLLRERRHVGEAGRAWRQGGGGAAPEYPHARAAALVADIARLGSSEEDGGGSFLDAFRGVVCQLGAALGFVRLVRLGALRHGNTAAACLPARPPDAELGACAARAGLAAPVQEAAQALDGVLSALAAGAGADYFAALLSVFAGELRGEANAHLRQFWLLVPALSLSHCDALLAAKDRLTKRGRDALSAGFTDDGFALGVAYLLRLLGQDADFDKLRWHHAAIAHYTHQAAQAGPRGAAPAAAQEDAAAAADLRQLKNAALLTEVKLLHFTLSGARTFFA